jgi:hypothetical protein
MKKNIRINYLENNIKTWSVFYQYRNTTCVTQVTDIWKPTSCICDIGIAANEKKSSTKSCTEEPSSGTFQTHNNNNDFED